MRIWVRVVSCSGKTKVSKALIDNVVRSMGSCPDEINLSISTQKPNHKITTERRRI